MKANLINIQKFSIHDGPGIRTTVFFKGCPLRCKWCANPESQIHEIQIFRQAENCINCLTCFNTCKHAAISKDLVIDYKKCINCFECVKNCPKNCLTIKGEETDIEDCVKECIKDIEFYKTSKGGVTLSGGECFLQEEFATELIKELKKYDIHIAAETCGYVDKEVFKRLASKIDLLLFDFKHYDREKHKEATGVYNDLIIDNLKYAIDNGIDHLVRIPVIPGFNDSIEDAKKFSEKFKELKVDKVQLLPFHQLGEKKYELYNMNYVYKDVKALHKEDLEEYKQVFLDNGIEGFF